METGVTKSIIEEIKNGTFSTSGIKPFSIIKHAGIVSSAVTLDGKQVYRTDKIWWVDKLVDVVQYDNHFIYPDMSKKRGRWWAMCTCGAPAVVVGYNAYKQDASPTATGEMVVCMFHAQNGKHSDGSS